MKPTITKKLLCLFLTAGMLLLGACDGDGGTESSDDSFESSEEAVVSKDSAGWLESLENANGKYKGKTINIVSVSSTLFYDDADNPLARAVVKRNGLIQQYMDLSINCTEKSKEKIRDELKQAIKNGTQYADLICAPQSMLAELAEEGLLENLYSLPYIDFGAGYVNKAELSAQTAGNTLYMYSGELTHCTSSCYGIYYNKALVGISGGDPVKLAKNGTLTWSALEAMVQIVADNGKHGIDSLLDESELAVAIYGSSGKSIVAAGSGKKAESVYDAQAAQTTANILSGLFKNGKYSANYDEKNAINAFKTGKLGFLVASLDSVSLFDGCESEWGLLPLPKHSSEQSTYSGFVGGDALAVAVPRGCSDSAFSGFALNALLAASSNLIEPELKSTYVNYHFWSNDAAVMLNVIERTKTFDIGVIYSSNKTVADVGAALLIKENGGKVTEPAKESFLELASKLFY